MSHLMNTYARQNVTSPTGKGLAMGRQWQTLSGPFPVSRSTPWGMRIRVSPLHFPRRSAKLIHTSNLYQVREQELIADKLCEISDAGSFSVQFRLRSERSCDQAGTYVRQPAGIDTPTIIVMEKAFQRHAEATLSAPATARCRPALTIGEGFVRVPYETWKPSAKSRLTPQYRRCAGRTDPGRRRPSAHPTSATCMACADLRRARVAADAGRGAMRPGQNRQMVRLPTHRHHAGRDDSAKGLGSGVPWRCLLRARQQARSSGQPRLDFRRQSAGLDCRVDHTEHHGAGQTAGPYAKVGGWIKRTTANAPGRLEGRLTVRGQGLILASNSTNRAANW